MTIKTAQIWDLPLRAFHWLIVLTVLAAYVTAKVGGEYADWHGRIGSLILGLLIFRLAWGFLGSTHARFTNFAPTPTKLKIYLQGNWKSHGHNPLGAISVLALLGTLAALIGTGLFANDDIAFQGPLYPLVEKSYSDVLTANHERAFYGLLALIVLHLLAIGFYWVFKKNNLINPMITGYKEVATEEHETISGGGKFNFLVALAFSVAIVWLIFSGVLLKHLSHFEIQKPSISTQKW